MRLPIVVAPSRIHIEAKDENEKMPPVKSGKKLSVVEVATLRKWIAGGAKFAPHWAYVPPVRREVPADGIDSDDIGAKLRQREAAERGCNKRRKFDDA